MEFDSSAEFDAARDAECFAAVPARPAVFLVEPRAELAGAQPYLLRTANLRERLKRLLGPPEPASKRLNLREFAARVHYRVAASPFELNFLHWQHARRLWPGNYRERARLRPPAVLKVSLTNAYPRCYATRRISANGFYFGPFRSRRAADAFASGFLDLFKIRRCQIKIRRDPAFPGCMYSEMKMCLAPCFAGCTKQEYDAEVGRVVAFLGTRGASLTAELEREREAASEALDFERAAAVHRRIEKAEEALRGLPEAGSEAGRPQRRNFATGRGGKHGGRIRRAGGPHRGAAHAALRGAGQRAAIGRADPARMAGAVRGPGIGRVRRRIRRRAAANWKITWVCWRGGFIRSRESAKCFFAKPQRALPPPRLRIPPARSATANGRIAGFCGRARDCSRRSKANQPQMNTDKH